ncbi:MAG: PD-(D/E)XK nuclease family protein [Rhodocyclaceae bacterium]
MPLLMAGEPAEPSLASTPLPPGEDFLETVAAAMLERCSGFSAPHRSGDFSAVLVFAPAQPIAAELRHALLRVAGRPLLLPTFDTLTHWAQTSPIPDLSAPLADSERLVLLHEALRDRQWFDEGALWGIASEMAALFDELTAAAVRLPTDEAALTAQLEQAYALRASAPLAFEARVVHELWRALSGAGRPDAAALYRLRLARLAELAERPLLVLLDAAPSESLDPAERDFLVRYAERQPVALFHPAPRSAASTPLLATLAAAWPESAAASADPLYDRALALAAQLPDSPLAGRLQLVPAMGREQEAQAAVAQVGNWLDEGLRRIVLITQDRLTARRVRALLEREEILVVDETGWLLSTSRAAAAIDALVEIAAGGAYYRDVLDLCKSPYVFADCPEAGRKAAVFALESAIRRASARAGLARFRQCLLAARDDADDAQALAAKALGSTLLDRIEAASTLLRSRPAPLPRWIDRLNKSLEALAALPLLLADPAGKALLDLLAARRQELDGSSALFSFSAWRDWLNREFEAASFRDGSIASPIVLTPLNAVCLRRFEAALLLGGDARQLTPAAGGAFFNQSVRRELGLPTRENAECELRRDLELLLATVQRVVVTWQAEHDGEANLLAPDLDLLATLHRLAWSDDLHRPPLPARHEAQPAADSAPGATRGAAPVAPAALIPQRVSVSAYASLVACPYRFFARHVLGLGEMDEVSEEMGKSDYGALVHRVLERFHARHPLISELDETEALLALQACVAEVFAPAVEENFLAIGWRLRWEKRLAAYLDWQRGVEAAGWRWAQAETRVSRLLPLAAGGSVELYGRIDRIDTIGIGEASVSLLDYKTQSATKIRERLADDVQLPAYALLHGDAAQAAYVALDDERIVAVAAGDDEGSLMFDAAAQGERLRAAFDAMHGGAPLPAHGTDRECQWCEMSGLCRRPYV